MVNYFTVRCGDMCERAENTVLPSFSGLFVTGDCCKSITLTADGKHFTQPAERVAACRNPAGVPFFRYSAVFSDSALDGVTVQGVSLGNGADAVINYAPLSGELKKTAGQSVSVECTVFLEVQKNGIRLLEGENPLYDWLVGENRTAEWSAYPLLRDDALQYVTTLPANGRIGVEVQTSEGEISLSVSQIPDGVSALAFLLDGIAIMTYQTQNTEQVQLQFEYVPITDTVVMPPDAYAYRAQTDGEAAEPVYRTYGYLSGTPRPLGESVDAERCYAVGTGKAFALVSGTEIEVFSGMGDSRAPYHLDGGQPISAVAMGGESFVAVALRDGTIRRYELVGGLVHAKELNLTVGGVTSMGISADGLTLLAATAAGSVHKFFFYANGDIRNHAEYAGEGKTQIDAVSMTAIRLNNGVFCEFAYGGEQALVRTVEGEYGQVLDFQAVGTAIAARLADGSCIAIDKGSGLQTYICDAGQTATWSPCGTYVSVCEQNGKTNLYFYNGEMCATEQTELCFPVGARVLAVSGGAICFHSSSAWAFPIISEYGYLLFSPARGNAPYHFYRVDKCLSPCVTVGIRAVV